MRVKAFFALLIAVPFLLFSNKLHAEGKKLSDKAQVILFTCGPGLELYAGFGHSALWIGDPDNHIDRLYNYGTFDFEIPHFYTKFVRGKLDYMLSVTTVDRFLIEYDYRKISVYGQTLNLTSNEKQRLYEFLENNAKPENRLYRYDFFYDNCATRFRDVLDKIADGKVNYNIPNKNTSLRKLLWPYLPHTPWTKTGINMILGLPSDKLASTEEYMYLPEYLKIGFENATITKDGETRKLVSSGHEYLHNKLKFERTNVLSPNVVFGLILLIVALLSVWEIRKQRYFRWIDKVLMSVSIAGGIFLFLMWVATDHTTVKDNMNCFWMFPAQFFFLFVISNWFKPKKSGALIALGYLSIYLLIQAWLPQETEVSFYILQLIYILRFAAGWYRWK